MKMQLEEQLRRRLDAARKSIRSMYTGNRTPIRKIPRSLVISHGRFFCCSYLFRNPSALFFAFTEELDAAVCPLLFLATGKARDRVEDALGCRRVRGGETGRNDIGNGRI